MLLPTGAGSGKRSWRLQPAVCCYWNNAATDWKTRKETLFLSLHLPTSLQGPLLAGPNRSQLIRQSGKSYLQSSMPSLIEQSRKGCLEFERQQVNSQHIQRGTYYRNLRKSEVSIRKGRKTPTNAGNRSKITDQAKTFAFSD